MNTDRFPSEPTRPTESDETIRLECWTQWTDQELLDDLKRCIDPSKTYRTRMPDRCYWFQVSGENLLILASAVVANSTEEAVRQLEGHDELITAAVVNDAVKELFEGMRMNISLKDPSQIRRWFARLEYPQPDGVWVMWEEDAPIIRFP
jgi:hypothetical protein